MRIHQTHRDSLGAARLGLTKTGLSDLTSSITWTPANTALAGLALSALVTAPTALVASRLLKHKSMDRDQATAAQLRKNTLDAKRVVHYVASKLKTRPRIERTRELSPLDSAMEPASNKVRVSYYGSPALLAHELGHAVNVAKDRQTVLGRALSGLTNLAYSPITPVLSGGSLLAFATDHPALGIAGVGATGLLSLTQLVEEARASRKARKILRDIYGDKIKSSDYMLPLGAGFSTYLANALARVGAPVAAEFIQESSR